MERRLNAPWRPLEAIPVAVVAFVAWVIVGSLAVLAVDEALAMTLLLMALPVALAVTTAVWLAVRHPGGLAVLGLPPDRPGNELTQGLAWGAGLFVLAAFGVTPIVLLLVRLITGEPVEAPQQQVLPEDPETLHVILGGIGAIVAAPIGEELFFRGLLHTSLRTRLGFPVAASISSAIFAAVHAIPLLIPTFFVVGLGLAYVYERRGSLLAPIAAHAGFNVIGYVLIARAMA
jgi:uncharacterized protein